MNPIRCKICHNLNGNEAFDVREMMFGSRERFTYTKCSNCACLFKNEIPVDLTPYYPTNYYSFSNSGWLKTAAHRARVRRALGSRSWLGALAVTLLGEDQGALAISRAKLKKADRIVDIGCGDGMLIRSLRECGHKNISGIDAYIAEKYERQTDGVIRKLSLFELTGTYDAFLLNHSYEHMSEPLAVLKKLKSLLAPEGCIIIRIPVVDSRAWRVYGANWVNLDAPRHFFLHSKKSIEILASQTGLFVESTISEGTAFGHLGSEQYKKDIPLADKRSYYSGGVRRWVGWFKAKKMAANIASLNLIGDGDCACFTLRVRR